MPNVISPEADAREHVRLRRGVAAVALVLGFAVAILAVVSVLV